MSDSTTPEQDPGHGASEAPRRVRRGTDPALPSYHVGGAAGAAAVLKALAKTRQPARLTQLARDTGLNMSTCLNILRTLDDSGLVSTVPGTKTYTLGLGVVALAGAALARQGPVAMARPLMQSVASRYNVTVNLWRRINAEESMLLALMTGDAAWRIQADIGTCSPLLSGAVGRLMVMYHPQPEAQLREQFQKVGWRSSLSFEQFMAEAAESQRRGWSCDDGHYNTAMLSLGVPCFDNAGNVDLALSAAMFAGQHDTATHAEIAHAMMGIAETIRDSIT